MGKGITSNKDIWIIDVDPRISSVLPMVSTVSVGLDFSKRSSKTSFELHSLSFK